jgi:dihydroorotase
MKEHEPRQYRLERVSLWDGRVADIELITLDPYARDWPEGESDARNLHLLPGLVDLCCEAGFPGFPERETRSSLRHAAMNGGFTDLLLSPATDPVLDTPEQLRKRHSFSWQAAGALTAGLQGEQLSELGLLAKGGWAAGVAAFSDGGRPISSTLVLRNALEYASRLSVPVLLRPAEPELDRVGVVHESPFSAELGLRGNPAATEEIGIVRICALLKHIRCPPLVHLTHISTAAGVSLIESAQQQGLPISASTPARNLILDETALENYDTRFRLHPPLRSTADRLALTDAVARGILYLSADHQPRSPEEKEHEFERAVSGSSSLESAFSAAWTALEAYGLPTLVQAFSFGPSSLLKNPVGGWVLVDLKAEKLVDVAIHQSHARNDALSGKTLKGNVLATFPAARMSVKQPG